MSELDVHAIPLDHWKKLSDDIVMVRCWQCGDIAALPVSAIGVDGIVEDVECPHECGFKGTVRLGGWGVY